MKLSVFSFGFIFLSLFSSLGHAWDEFRGYSQGIWDLEFKSQYFNATGNYTRGGGSYDSLPSGYSYMNFLFDMGARYSATDRMAYYFGTQVGYARSEDPLAVHTNSSLTHLKAGADFLMYDSKRVEIVPEAFFIYPIQRVDPDDDAVLNSEGAIEVGGRVIGRFRTASLTYFAYAGLTYRDEGRSALLPYGLGTELLMGPASSIGGEIKGYQSISDDENTSNPSKRERTANYNGGTVRYYSVNPDLTEANLWYRMDEGRTWAFQFGGGTTLTGAATAAGWNIFAVLNYRFRTTPSVHSPKMRTAPKSQDFEPSPDDTEKFQETTDDGVDQSLFQNVPVTTTTTTTTPVPVKKVKSSKKAPKEFQIQLKSIRKKR